MNNILPISLQANVNELLGVVEKPAGVGAFDSQAGGVGLLVFISNGIQLLTVVAGIWTLFNIIFAGYIYITASGDSGAASKVSDKITQSVIGLLIIVGAYSIVGLLGLLLFGDAGYFLNPTITGPGA